MALLPLPPQPPPTRPPIWGILGALVLTIILLAMALVGGPR